MQLEILGFWGFGEQYVTEPRTPKSLPYRHGRLPLLAPLLLLLLLLVDVPQRHCAVVAAREQECRVALRRPQASKSSVRLTIPSASLAHVHSLSLWKNALAHYFFMGRKALFRRSLPMI